MLCGSDSNSTDVEMWKIHLEPHLSGAPEWTSRKASCLVCFQRAIDHSSLIFLILLFDRILGLPFALPAESLCRAKRQHNHSWGESPSTSIIWRRRLPSCWAVVWQVRPGQLSSRPTSVSQADSSTGTLSWDLARSLSCQPGTKPAKTRLRTAAWSLPTRCEAFRPSLSFVFQVAKECIQPATIKHDWSVPPTPWRRWQVKPLGHCGTPARWKTPVRAQRRDSSSLG